MNLDFLAFLIAALFSLILFLISSIFLKRYFWIISIGFALRLFMIFIHEKTHIFGNADIIDYLHIFINFRWTGINDLLDYIQPPTTFYTFLYPGWIFNNLGESELWVIRVVNAALGVAVIAPLTWMKQIVFKKNLTQAQAFMIVLWPTWIRYTIEVGRSAPSVVAVIFTISSILAIANSPKVIQKIINLFFTIFYFFISIFLRTHYIAYFMPILAVILINQTRKLKISNYIRPIIYFFAILGSLIGFVAFFSIYQQLNNIEGNNLEYALNLAQAAEAEAGGSTYLQGIYARNVFDLVWYLPLQAFYFLFSPMPWDVRNIFMLGSCLQAGIIFILCLQVFKKGHKILMDNNLLMLLLISILISSLTLGLGVKNAGSAERWRLPSTLILMTMTTSILDLPKNMKPKYVQAYLSEKHSKNN
jgi:hypothetical protein